LAPILEKLGRMDDDEDVFFSSVTHLHRQHTTQYDFRFPTSTYLSFIHLFVHKLMSLSLKFILDLRSYAFVTCVLLSYRATILGFLSRLKRHVNFNYSRLGVTHLTAYVSDM
jgi:hypothetical protein